MGQRFRSPYKRRNGGTVAAFAAGALLASAVAARGAVSASHPPQHAVHHAQVVTDVQAGTSETSFFTAVLADLGDRATAEDLGSLAAWAGHEGPWGSVGAWNPLDSILPMPGSWPFNTFAGDLHVQNYPDAAEGAQATARTIGGFPAITAALRSGSGVCGGGLAYEFGRWSGGGYTEVC